MKKVYLAKSNKCNPDNVQIIRKLLKNYDCEIIEHKGGSFSHKPMMKSDILIVLPYLEEYVENNIVGRGLYSQIEEFERTGKPCLVVYNIDKQISVGNIIDKEVLDYNDFFEYGEVCVDPVGPLKNSLNEFFGLSTDVLMSKKNNYLLICK